MRRSASEKMELIGLVERTDLPVRVTLVLPLIAATNAFFPETESRQIRRSAQFRS